MSIFIKAGLWTKKAHGLKGELDLDFEIKKVIDSNKILRGLLQQSSDNDPNFTPFKNTLGVNIVSFVRQDVGVYIMTFDTDIFQSPFEDTTIVGSCATTFSTFTAVPVWSNVLLIESSIWGGLSDDALGTDGPCVLQIIKYN